jgi:hypothetical protein
MHEPPSLTYRELQLARCEKEHERSLWLYAAIDDIEGTDRRSRYEECRTIAYLCWNRESRLLQVASNSCRLRWCPLCSRSGARRRTESVKAWLLTLNRPKFITLTLRHSNSPLTDQINHLYKHFRNLRRNSLFKKIVAGGVWFFQVKRNKSGSQWHPHLHCLVDSGFFPQKSLASLWESITQSSRIVDVRSVTDAEETSEYAARYCTRPANLADYSYTDCIEIFTALHGRRLCGAWGTAFRIALKKPAYEEAGTTIRVGSFSDIIKYWSKSKNVRELYNLYQTGRPVGEELINKVSRYLGNEFQRSIANAMELCDLSPPS